MATQTRELTAMEQRKQEQKQQIIGFGKMVEALSPNLQQVAPQGASIEKMQRIAITAVQKNPDLLECTRESWITALQLCAQDGLMPDGREAAFVKFGGKGPPTVAYMPMVYGLRKKILQSGEISNITTAPVYEREFQEGLFEVELGSNPRIVHRPLLGAGERGPIIAAYSVATFKDGTQSFEVMTRAEIDRVKMVSQTGKKNEGPWNEQTGWFGEMARKTVLRRHSKSLPMSGDLRDVEVEQMFGKESFDRAISQRDEGSASSGAPRGTTQLANDTSEQLDAIEGRAAGGATVDVPHDPETGEVQDTSGDAPTAADQAEALAHEEQVAAADWVAWLKALPAQFKGMDADMLDVWDPPADVPAEHLKMARGFLRDEHQRRQKKPPAAKTKDQPAEEEGPSEAETNAADDFITMVNDAEFLMDLRQVKAKHGAAIDQLHETERTRVWAAYEAREQNLGQRPK